MINLVFVMYIHIKLDAGFLICGDLLSRNIFCEELIYFVDLVELSYYFGILASKNDAYLIYLS